MIVTLLLIIAVFLAKVSNLINVEVIVKDNEVTKSDITIKNITINNKLEHLIWFLQVVMKINIPKSSNKKKQFFSFLDIRYTYKYFSRSYKNNRTERIL